MSVLNYGSGSITSNYFRETGSYSISVLFIESQRTTNTLTITSIACTSGHHANIVGRGHLFLTAPTASQCPAINGTAETTQKS